jgi:hypothetical protein
MPATVVVGILLTSAVLAGVGISALVMTVYVVRGHRGGWPHETSTEQLLAEVNYRRHEADPDATIVLSFARIAALGTTSRKVPRRGTRGRVLFGNHEER